LVTPISGERYRALDRLSELIAPPYDVISPSDRSALAARHPHNIVHVMLPEANGDRYTAAAKLLDQWRKEGVLQRDPEPAVYVLRQDFATPDGARYARTGVFVAVAAEPYAPGRVRPHEKTHAGPKADRLALMEATGTMLESIFLLAPDVSGQLRSLLQQATKSEPTVRADLGGVAISLWRVSGAAGEKIAAAAGSGALYIADGHHRYETAGAYRQRNARAERTIALVVPLGDPGLVVLPTHRLVVNGKVGEQEALADRGKRFAVEEVESELDPESLLAEAGRDTTAALLALPGGKIFLLRLRADADLGALGRGVTAKLDVARVDALVVAPLVKLAGQGARVEYTADPAVLFSEVAGGKAGAGVMLNPTKVQDVMEVADAGEVMPQKSTYFIPKVPSGLVLLPHPRADR
jgi:uncharacterized protein (DUF1015 family)